MQMKMEYRLARAGADVEDRPIAVFDAAFAGDFGGHKLAAAQGFRVRIFRLFESHNVFSGNNQHVGRGLGIDVFEGEGVFVFINFLCGNPARENLAEKTVSHEEDFKFKISNLKFKFKDLLTQVSLYGNSEERGFKFQI